MQSSQAALTHVQFPSGPATISHMYPAPIFARAFPSFSPRRPYALGGCARRDTVSVRGPEVEGEDEEDEELGESVASSKARMGMSSAITK